MKAIYVMEATEKTQARPDPVERAPFKKFEVTLRFQFPAWDEKDGITYEETARSKKDAIKYARRQAENDGHVGVGGKGRVSFKAVEVAE